MAAISSPIGHNSVRQAAIKVGVPYPKALKLCRQMGFKKYKIHVAPSLKRNHYADRIEYAKWFHEEYRKDPLNFVQNIFYSDETHCSLRAPQIKNLFHWGFEKPPVLEISQSQSEYVSAWGCVSANFKFDLIFPEQPKKGTNGQTLVDKDNQPRIVNAPVNTKVYIEQILIPVEKEFRKIGKIQDGKLVGALFMQDG